jgi:hypothetical protein
MRALRVTGLALALAAAAACGKSPAEKQAEETAKAIEQATKSAEQASKSAEEAGKSAGQAAQEASKGLEQFAKGLQGMAGAMSGTNGNQQPVEPVSFKELQTVFVPLDGWEMGKPTGEKLTMPFAYSQAKVKYHKGESRIEVTVTDSGLNQLFMVPFGMFLTAGYEKETENGYEKSAKIAGYPGWEKWNSSSKNGEVNAFVNKRFLVQIEGDDVEDTKVLHQLAESSNLAKLAAMK